MGNEDIRERYVKKGITLPFDGAPPGGADADDSWYDPEQISESLNSSGQVADYGDLKTIHVQMNAARTSLYRIISEQSKTDRELSVAEQKYKRAWNRSYMADIENEELQNRLIELQIRSKELTRRAQFLRDDLKASESLSNDYRQLIRSTS